MATIQTKVEDEILRIVREKTNPTIGYICDTIAWPETKTISTIYAMQERGVIYLDTEGGGSISVRESNKGTMTQIASFGFDAPDAPDPAETARQNAMSQDDLESEMEGKFNKVLADNAAQHTSIMDEPKTVPCFDGGREFLIPQSDAEDIELSLREDREEGLLTDKQVEKAIEVEARQPRYFEHGGWVSGEESEARVREEKEKDALALAPMSQDEMEDELEADLAEEGLDI
jgi:hypothetical protein